MLLCSRVLQDVATTQERSTTSSLHADRREPTGHRLPWSLVSQHDVMSIDAGRSQEIVRINVIKHPHEPGAPHFQPKLPFGYAAQGFCHLLVFPNAASGHEPTALRR